MATVIHFLQKQRHGRSGRKRLCVSSWFCLPSPSVARSEPPSTAAVCKRAVRRWNIIFHSCHLPRPELSPPIADSSSISQPRLQGQRGINTISNAHDAMTNLITHWRVPCFHFARRLEFTFAPSPLPTLNFPSLHRTPSNWTFLSRRYPWRPITAHSLGNWHTGLPIHVPRMYAHLYTFYIMLSD